MVTIKIAGSIRPEHLCGDVFRISADGNTFEHLRSGKVLNQVSLLNNNVTRPSQSIPRGEPDGTKLSGPDPLEWANRGVLHFDAEENKTRGGMQLFNRTFPGRFDDHIALLRDLGFSNRTSHFIDIGPGVGETKNEQGRTMPGDPAITSLEMARAFPNMNVVALDLPESVESLRSARIRNENIGRSLLNQANVRVISGDGLKPLRAQLCNGRDAFSGLANADIGPQDPVVIRASNSIDIYCDWKTQTKPALHRMAREFESNPAVLLFNDKILMKAPGSTEWIPVGKVSNRGFNHWIETTRHVRDDVPRFTYLATKESVVKKLTLASPELVASR